jgi:hypothetical protein
MDDALVVRELQRIANCFGGRIHGLLEKRKATNGAMFEYWLITDASSATDTLAAQLDGVLRDQGIDWHDYSISAYSNITSRSERLS